MIDFAAFSDELVKIAEDSKKERLREAARHSLAAGAGTAAGIAGADLLASQVAKKMPHLAPALQSKAARYGIPALMAAGSVYASQKYKKNVDDAMQRVGSGKQ